MHSIDWLQLILFVAMVTAMTKPVGLYLGRVLEPGSRTWLDSILGPLERGTYALLGVRADRGQTWKEYAVALLTFGGVGCWFTYAILRLQHWLPLNPQGFGPVSPHLAFNTAVSFVTNTDWQSYGGESTLSYFSQMVGLTLQNFVSAAVGIAVAAVLVRAVSRESSVLGNFWVDLIRVTYYLLLPGSLVFAVFLVAQGIPQSFSPYAKGRWLESGAVGEERGAVRDARGGGPSEEERTVEGQTLVRGPVASQVAIKMLGTNGGGFMNANAAHPLENPTPASNFVQMLAIFAIGSGLTYHLGQRTGRPDHGWSLWGAMMILFLGGVLVCWGAELGGNPIHQALGVAGSDGNMEGKEVRFGILNSALFATATTGASCGAVNAMHDSLTPVGGLVALFNMQLGEIIFGGVGSGLYGMMVFVVLSVFIAGLMVGRSPEYLGKKIGAYEVKMAMLSLLVVCVSILGFSAWAVVTDWGQAGPSHAGPHGSSQIVYAFSSASANNGSAFAGLDANSPAYNTALGLAMLSGRYLVIIPILAMAGSVARKKILPPGPGTFPVAGGTFVVLLLGTILLVGALNFLPALALGPVVEHFLMVHGQLQ